MKYAISVEDTSTKHVIRHSWVCIFAINIHKTKHLLQTIIDIKTTLLVYAHNLPYF